MTETLGTSPLQGFKVNAASADNGSAGLWPARWISLWRWNALGRALGRAALRVLVTDGHRRITVGCGAALRLWAPPWPSGGLSRRRSLGALRARPPEHRVLVRSDRVVLLDGSGGPLGRIAENRSQGVIQVKVCQCCVCGANALIRV